MGLTSCPIATEGVNHALADATDAEVGSELVIAEAADEIVACVRPGQAPGTVTEVAGGRQWQVGMTGFWQAHRQAPDVLVAAVAPYVSEAQTWWDLYCGVGLFAGALARPGARITAVEGDRRAAGLARKNLADLPDVRVHTADVGQWLSRAKPAESPDTIVLDPPRSGVGRDVVAGLTSADAQRLVYVACDPAALGRDVAYLRAQGWELRSVTGYDLFPMTHHVEAVAVLQR